MNLKHTPLLFALAALATVTLAQEKKEFPARERAAQPNREEMREKMMLKRFDKDGDGKLNAEEKAAMENEKKETMTKFDKDGDGVLNAEERKAMMEERRKAMVAPEGKEGEVKREGAGMRQGAGFAPEAREKMLKKFDKDGDGKLNEEERKAMMDERKAMTDKFDADKDGKLNEEERAKLMEHLKALNAEKPEEKI